jgi:uncharacterized protein YaaQ
MKQKTKRVTMTVDYMENADPRFVSIVNHGANQTPFAVIKHAKGATHMPKKLQKSSIKRKVKLIKSVPKVTGVRKIVFDKAIFKTEESVRKYLEQNNWEDDYTITAAEKSFEVSGEGVADSDFSNIKEVPMTKGVTGFIGEVKEEKGEDDNSTAAEGESNDDTGAATGENEDNKDDAKADEGAAKETVTENAEANPEQKSDEKVTKYDYWNAYFSDEQSLTGILKDGMEDDLPPGFEAVMGAISKAAANVLGDESKTDDEKKSYMENIGAEFADVIMKISKTFNEIVADAKASKSEKAYVETQKSFISKHTDKKAAEPADSKIVAKKEDSSLDEIKSLLANVCKSVDTVVQEVGNVKTQVTESLTVAKEAKEQVDSLQNKAPAKKAVNIDAVDDKADPAEKAEKAEESKDKEFAKKLARNLIGL